MWLLLKNLAFTVLVPGTVAVLVPLWLAADAPFVTGVRLAASVALLALGGSVYAWCLWDFASYGRGTPAPIDAPKRLVVRGLYRIVRNPMYVGVLMVIGGQALLFESWLLAGYAAGVGMAFHLFVVRYEEPRLRELFGADYDRYRTRVGRWLPR